MHNSIAHLTTGIRCSDDGLHLGHYIGNIAPIMDFKQDKVVFFILGDNHPAEWLLVDSGYKSIESILVDTLACGLDSENIYYVRQSELRRQTSALFEVLLEFTTQRQLEKIHPRRNTIRSGGTVELCDYLFPFQQAVDVLALHSEYVVSNVDNLALVNYSRHIAQKFNNKYKRKALSTPSLLHGRVEKVLGYDRRKMSRSNNNYLSLSSTSKQIKEYVEKIFEFPNRVHGTSEGKLRRNLAFLLLEGLEKKNQETSRIKEEYALGMVTEKMLKDFLFAKLDIFFMPIQERRNYFTNHPQIIHDAVEKGSLYLKQISNYVDDKVLKAVRRLHEKEHKTSS